MVDLTIGFMLIVFFTIMLGMLTHKTIGAIIGAVIGVIISSILGLLSISVIFIIIALLILSTVIYFQFGGRV